MIPILLLQGLRDYFAQSHQVADMKFKLTSWVDPLETALPLVVTCSGKTTENSPYDGVAVFVLDSGKLGSNPLSAQKLRDWGLSFDVSPSNPPLRISWL